MRWWAKVFKISHTFINIVVWGMCLYVFVDAKLRGIFQDNEKVKAINLALLAKERSHIYDENKNEVMYFKRGANAKV